MIRDLIESMNDENEISRLRTEVAELKRQIAALELELEQERRLTVDPETLRWRYEGQLALFE
jgi:predicted  nucleic acid-binding Zn-ribbon protein